jgi:hypothetical protein
MKKVVCLIAVLALTATVCAQEPITITAVPSGDTLTIGYDASGAAAMPVGISLIVDCGVGNVASAGDADFSIDSFFDVFIDFAADDPAAYQAGADPATGVLAGAHGLAMTDMAGAVAFPAQIFAISAAELANTATIPAIGTICVLTLSGTPATVTFAEDTLRGGVVDVNGNPMAVTLPGPTLVPGAVAPTCWDLTECAGQPDGDTNCDGAINFLDIGVLKAAFFASTGQPNYNCCADFDHSGQVNFLDLGKMKANFFVTGYTPSTGNTTCP